MDPSEDFALPPPVLPLAQHQQQQHQPDAASSQTSLEPLNATNSTSMNSVPPLIPFRSWQKHQQKKLLKYNRKRASAITQVPTTQRSLDLTYVVIVGVFSVFTKSTNTTNEHSLCIVNWGLLGMHSEILSGSFCMNCFRKIGVDFHVVILTSCNWNG